METPGAEVRQHAGGKALGGSGDNTAIATPSTAAASPDPALSPPSFASASAPSHHSEHETPDALQSLQLQPGRTAMSIVHQAYGPGADLYRDVLRVGPAATDREIRTAYFRRGRQVLQQPDGDAVLVQQKHQKQKQEESTAAEEELDQKTVGTSTVKDLRARWENKGTDNDVGGGGGGVPSSAPSASPSAGPMSMATVTQRSKLQFQAVSAAFDILSDPELRRQYDDSGTIEPDSLTPLCLTLLDGDQEGDARPTSTHKKGQGGGTSSSPSPPSSPSSLSSLKNSLPAGRRGLINRNRSKNFDSNSSVGSNNRRGIRWSLSVEELVIENDCASIASRRGWGRCGGGLADVEDGDAAVTKGNDGNDENAVSGVQETLRRLDNGAQSLTRKEFLEELETSVTTLLAAASTAITEASAAASAAVAATVPTTAESAEKSDDKDADALANSDSAAEPLVKDSVSRKLSFDNADEKKTTSSSDDSPTDKTANADANPKAATSTAAVAAEEEDPAADFYIFLSTYICGVVQELKASLEQMGSYCGGELPSPSSCIIQDAELDGLVHMLRTEVDQQIDEAVHHPFDEDPSGESPLGKTIEAIDTESIASTIATERNAPAGNFEGNYM